MTRPRLNRREYSPTSITSFTLTRRGSGQSSPQPTSTVTAYGSSTPAAIPMPVRRKASIGAIAGGVIGGVLVVITAVISLLVWRRQKKQRESAEFSRRTMKESATPFSNNVESQMTPSISTDVISPFMSAASAYPSSSKPFGTGNESSLTYTSPPIARITEPLVYENSGDSNYAYANSPPERSVDPAGASSAAIPLDGRGQPHTSDSTSHAAALETAPRHPVTVTGLLNQLNDLLARLPPGGVDEEEPPEYEDL